jgi:hypothetical protein
MTKKKTYLEKKHTSVDVAVTGESVGINEDWILTRHTDD